MPYANDPNSVVRTPSAAELALGIPCGPFDLALFNGIIQRLTDLLEASGQDITGGSYNPETNILTLTSEAGNILIDLANLVSDAQAGIPFEVTGYDMVTNIMYLTHANGATSLIDMSNVLADAAAGAGGVPANRKIRTNDPLKIDGVNEADMSADRTISLDPAFLASYNDAVAAIAASRPRAGTFQAARGSGNVQFSTPFPAGTQVAVLLTPRTNWTGSDGDDELIWVSGANNLGFNWVGQGDGWSGQIFYMAVPFF